MQSCGLPEIRGGIAERLGSEHRRHDAPGQGAPWSARCPKASAYAQGERAFDCWLQDDSQARGLRPQPQPWPSDALLDCELGRYLQPFDSVIAQCRWRAARDAECQSLRGLPWHANTASDAHASGEASDDPGEFVLAS